MFQPYLESLQNAGRRFAEESSLDSPWVCKTGLWPGPAGPEAAVLKLLKPHWSQDLRESIISTSEIFFSVWVDEEAVKRGGVHYNLHALKLRQMSAYALESRKFASAFRAAFGSRSNGWPGVTMAFGPQILFQGFVKCPPRRVEEATLTLLRKFMPLGTLVDDLLARAAKRSPLSPRVPLAAAGVC